MFLTEKYIDIVTSAPKRTLVLVCLLVAALGWFVQDFRMDASSDTLVMEGDADLEFARQMSRRYGTSDFVFIAFRPYQDLFTQDSLVHLRALRDELEAMERIRSVDSIYSVPLLTIANVPLIELADNIMTLDDPGLDLEDARRDLTSSQAFRDVLISADGQTTALIANFYPDDELRSLREQRDALRAIPRAGRTAEQRDELTRVELVYRELSTRASRWQSEDIAEIRAILDRYREHAEIHMAGVPMIADDLISFVRSDLATFGLAILAFIIIALSYLFRKPRYVLMPLFCCALTAISISGLLGYFDWPVTVISANFISLLLIITISLNVHLIVRYRELEAEGVCDTHQQRVQMTIRNMARPCAYTSLTTIVAFGSLVVSDIPPVVNFGWMMVLGVFSAFLLTFLCFPVVMSLLAPSPSGDRSRALDVTPYLAQFTRRHGKKILLFSVLLLVASVLGMGRLQVENSFIDYFDEDTEIYQGMVTIDRELGGTIPLDVIIDLFPPDVDGDNGALAVRAADEEEIDDDFFDDDFFFADDFAATDENEDAYWFTADKMQEVIAVHDWLDSLPETGKILSLGTLVKLAHELNEGEPLESIELAVLYTRIPEQYRQALLNPYVSVEHDQLRFSIRVRETNPELARNELLTTIREGLVNELGYSNEQVHLSGMFVLYNNMLQSLFQSQIMSLSLVLSLIFIMFIILFRSLKLAVIGIIPNILAAGAVLGLMGWLGIALDMMTITIAAISVGIGVDNTIHYIHRFKDQYPNFRDYEKTMVYCHGSIGQAMYYTSFTIIVGFSILVLSNFIPTIYFGLLTSLAMLIALAGALTLLPQLLITFRPLGGHR